MNSRSTFDSSSLSWPCAEFLDTTRVDDGIAGYEVRELQLMNSMPPQHLNADHARHSAPIHGFAVFQYTNIVRGALPL